MLGEPTLLMSAVLNDLDDVCAGPDRSVERRRAQAGWCNLLDFKGDHIAGAGQLGGTERIIEARGYDGIGNRTRGAVRLWIQDANVVAE